MADKEVGTQRVAMAEYRPGSWDGLGTPVDYPAGGLGGVDREVNLTLPKDATVRKGLPICTGVLDYFPLALAEVARCSKVGNDQHNPGQPLHWAREKSTDEADALVRHLIERGKTDTDGIRHSAKVAWRALALLQKEIEAEG